MSVNEPKNHHYAPQFYLKNFASDPNKSKVMTVTKHGDRAIWQSKSIRYLGAEEGLYTANIDGSPISVEQSIGSEIESPTAKSPTWEKIAMGRADSLTNADKPVICALMPALS